VSHKDGGHKQGLSQAAAGVRDMAKITALALLLNPFCFVLGMVLMYAMHTPVPLFVLAPGFVLADMIPGCGIFFQAPWWWILLGMSLNVAIFVYAYYFLSKIWIKLRWSKRSPREETDRSLSA